MSHPDTIAIYDRKAEDYARLVAEHGPEPDLARFLATLPEGGRLLDLGCGPGHTARRMIEAGFAVDALDASAEMVRLARAAGVDAQQATFDALEAEALYDGVWASFSLLHATKAAFPGHLAQVRQALRPGGSLFLGMKLGAGESADRLGRHYSYYAREELLGLLEEAGFSVIETREGRGTGLSGEVAPYIAVIARA